MKQLSFILLIFVLSTLLLLPVQMVMGQSNAALNAAKAEKIVEQALENAKAGNLVEANQVYQQFKNTWRDIEDGVKNESGSAYRDIESEMGKVVYAFSRNNQEETVQALEGLKQVTEKFIQGGYPQGEGFEQKNITLSQFITYLQDVRDKANVKNQKEAIAGIKKVTSSWLSVEGIVVAQSAKIYSDAEKDMVIVQAMLTNQPPDYDGAIQTTNQMISYLTPLADKSGYTVWDAAMIIIREGLEALLVIIALLAFVNKSNKSKGKGWIWSGVLFGIIVSVILAMIIKVMFSSGAFGNNNALIAGWTGIIAAVMLLYVSYWLHSNSNINKWQHFIQSKGQSALNTGKLISLGILAFLAVFREGTETVLFFIGMLNQISVQNLILGLIIGLGSLLIIAFLMIFIGVRLPIRPFFIVSSIIVFYLTVKFLGMGIHSLQLAGVVSTTNIPIPSVDLFAIYPSYESVLPQFALIAFALFIVIYKKISSSKNI